MFYSLCFFHYFLLTAHNHRRPMVTVATRSHKPDVLLLDGLAQELIATSMQKNLNSQVKSYCSFCDTVGNQVFPVSVSTIIRYIAYLVSLGCAYGTIQNHLSSIKHTHKCLGHELTWDKDYCFKLLLRGAKRHLGDFVLHKEPITSFPNNIFSLFDLSRSLHATMWALFSSSFILFSM